MCYNETKEDGQSDGRKEAADNRFKVPKERTFLAGPIEGIGKVTVVGRLDQLISRRKVENEGHGVAGEGLAATVRRVI